MNSYLFINYRKNDTVALADSLYVMFHDAFGDVVFKDSSILEKGSEFPKLIKDALDKSTCMLVLIGEKWLFQYDEQTGKRRLDLRDDWVRREIEHALKNAIDVIPVLAPGAKMPVTDALPETIRPLENRVAVPMRAESYVEDRYALLDVLIQKHGFTKQIRTRSTEENDGITAPPEHKKVTYSDEKAVRVKGSKAWINGTTLHYYFFNGNSANADVVRQAFQQWKDVGIGLSFEEVDDPEVGETRIAFRSGQGSWAYVGVDALNIPATEPTMNFGWDLKVEGGLDNVLHEIGHLLGLMEEHQNPHSGIVWDEKAVYDFFAAAPNYWNREHIRWQILRKGNSDNYYGPWDPNSIMHFPFGPGLIREPAEYRDGLTPSPGLSDGDREKIRFLYPPFTPMAEANPVIPLEPVSLSIQPGEQANFHVVPNQNRQFNFQTFGPVEVVMMLFEEQQEELLVLAADDNTGQQRSASIHANLTIDKRYVIKIRLFERTGDAVMMMW